MYKGSNDGHFSRTVLRFMCMAISFPSLVEYRGFRFPVRLILINSSFALAKDSGWSYPRSGRHCPQIFVTQWISARYHASSSCFGRTMQKGVFVFTLSTTSDFSSLNFSSPLRPSQSRTMMQPFVSVVKRDLMVAAPLFVISPAPLNPFPFIDIFESFDRRRMIAFTASKSV